MSETPFHVSDDFNLLVAEAQTNGLKDEEARWLAERKQAAELRAQNVSSYRRPDGKPARILNATELIGGKSRDERIADLQAELDAEDKAAAEAAAAHQGDRVDPTQKFPPPDITV